MRGPLAQHEMSESLLSDLVSVLVLGDVVPLGRLGLGVDAANRRMRTNLAHASGPDMRRMLVAARALQPILDGSEDSEGCVGATDCGPTQVRRHGRQVSARTGRGRAHQECGTISAIGLNNILQYRMICLVECLDQVGMLFLSDLSRQKCTKYTGQQGCDVPDSPTGHGEKGFSQTTNTD